MYLGPFSNVLRSFGGMLSMFIILSLLLVIGGNLGQGEGIEGCKVTNWKERLSVPSPAEIHLVMAMGDSVSYIMKKL